MNQLATVSATDATIIIRPSAKLSAKRQTAIDFTRSWEKYLIASARDARKTGDYETSYQFYAEANNARQTALHLQTASAKEIAEFWQFVFNFYRQNAN